MTSTNFQELVTTIGDRLKWLRLKRDVEQKKLAKQLNLTAEVMGQYEEGITPISAARLYQCSEIFDTPIDWFFPENERDSIIAKKTMTDADRYRQVDVHCISSEYWVVCAEVHENRWDSLGEFLIEADAYDYAERLQNLYPHLRRKSDPTS